MQLSVPPAKLQRQSVSLLQTAVMNRHIYISILVHQPAMCIDTMGILVEASGVV